MIILFLIGVAVFVSWLSLQPPNWDKIYKRTSEDVNFNRDRCPRCGK